MVMKWQSHTGDEQGESNWYSLQGNRIITKSELGLQGTQMADSYTGRLQYLGQVSGKQCVSMWQGQGLYSKGMSHEWSI